MKLLVHAILAACRAGRRASGAVTLELEAVEPSTLVLVFEFPPNGDESAVGCGSAQRGRRGRS